MGVKEDYVRPLPELFSQLGEETKVETLAAEKTIKKILILWLLFLSIFLFGIVLLVLANPADERPNDWFQRSGSLIALIAVLGETFFLVKLNKMVRVTHWAQLACEIYIERRYLKYLHILMAVTVVQLVVGTVIGSYGDLFFHLPLR
ncbi:MAG: hypothetical protein MRY76_14440 [Pseudomonadales bacterium]|nr:hypothetical protein [Pseudomonadales bacterium]